MNKVPCLLVVDFLIENDCILHAMELKIFSATLKQTIDFKPRANTSGTKL